MLALVKSRVSKVKFWLYNIYGPSGILEKRKLWKELLLVSSPLKDCMLVLGGDFNVISGLDEKSGGILPNHRIVANFGTFIQDMGLFDCKTQNGPFTWTTMRRYFSQISKILDRFLVSQNWIESPLEFSSLVLPNVGSDHFPVSFSILEDRVPQNISFKFEPMWFRDPSFLPLLKEWCLFAPFCLGSQMF